jgi:hypothetical protein
MFKLNENNPRKLKNLFKGLSFLSKNDIRKVLREMSEEKLYDDILLYFSLKKGTEMDEEADFLKRNSKITFFPYKVIKECGDIKCGKERGMNYVIHDGKKLFFPSSYSPSKCRDIYHNFIQTENILGTHNLEKCPHAYLSEDFQVENGTVLFDVGCAEGLFSLNVIEKVRIVILFESDREWIKPLKATFEPWKDKVIIINKLAGGYDNQEMMKLSSAYDMFCSPIKQEHNPIFVKMDIEGYELEVLKSSEKFIRESSDIKIACCTYHRQNDYIDIPSFFDSINDVAYREIKYNFSDGYMLPYRTDSLHPPYFRKGVLRATIKDL